MEFDYRYSKIDAGRIFENSNIQNYLKQYGMLNHAHRVRDPKNRVQNRAENRGLCGINKLKKTLFCAEIVNGR